MTDLQPSKLKIMLINYLVSLIIVYWTYILIYLSIWYRLPLSSVGVCFFPAPLLLYTVFSIVLFCLLCCFVYCVVFSIVLFSLLCCFVYCVVLSIVLFCLLCCFVYCVVLSIVLFYLLCCFLYCVVFSIVVFSLLCCFVYCVVSSIVLFCLYPGCEFVLFCNIKIKLVFYLFNFM
jgi:hypothetical protein